MAALVETLGSLVLAGALAAYVRGWWRLRRRGHAPPAWRLAAYALGVVTIAAALVGLDELADERFSVHMIQHLLLMMVAAPLLALGDPLPLVLWGLPRRARAPLAALLRPRARTRRALRALTWLPTAGILYVVIVWAWHVPALYDAAAEHANDHLGLALNLDAGRLQRVARPGCVRVRTRVCRSPTWSPPRGRTPRSG